MRRRFWRCCLALLICVGMCMSLLPIRAFAEPVSGLHAGDPVYMTEGEIRKEFVTPGTVCESDDPGVAWVDEEGNLNALKNGVTVIRTTTDDGVVETEVSVSDYSDGSEVAGNLKILARYNDEMDFYEGHVYLLFTSYLDDVTIRVDDLYEAYQISDRYYTDIRNDLSKGSNHTGKDTEPYFTLAKKQKEVVLDRGEIVTIGMYRGEEVSILETVLDSLTHSTVWKNLTNAGKAAVAEIVFQYFEKGKLSAAKVLERIKTVFDDEGLDFGKVLDGYAEGGVCFNRELYDQKLEWDQYENVTYEMDISLNELRSLEQSLGGNLDRFSPFNNSCATVALRAWNAAVGMRNGEKTAYYLDSEGEGINALMDVPETVRDEIKKKLKGYYSNSSSAVEEPYAGYQDETGWVYVSAPEPVDPVYGGENTLYFTVVNGAYAETDVEIYRFDQGEKVLITEPGEVAPGTKIYVKAGKDDYGYYLLEDLTLGGVSFFTKENYDDEEEAYTVEMPQGASRLKVIYSTASVRLTGKKPLQFAVGETLVPDDYAEIMIKGKKADAGLLKCRIISESRDGEVIRVNDDGSITALGKGTAKLRVYAAGNENMGAYLYLSVYESIDKMAAVSADDRRGEDYYLFAKLGDLRVEIKYDGFLVEKGSELSVVSGLGDEKMISEITVNGQSVPAGQPVVIDQDVKIGVNFKPVELTGIPAKIRIASADDSYRFQPELRFGGTTGSNGPTVDQITYVVSDPLIRVDDSGVLTVDGEIPEEGKCAVVTVNVTAAEKKFTANCKVIIGNYKGDRVVGTLTLHGRASSSKEIVPHGSLTLTTYEDLDLDVSYYEYYKPTKKYSDLLRSYENDPFSYPSDPALFSEEIQLQDRQSYFEHITHGAGAEPSKISLLAGESISISAFGFEESQLQTILRTLEGSSFEAMDSVQELIRQIRRYRDGEEMDGAAAFDSLISSAVAAFLYMNLMGENPLDGRSDGGICINREMDNQFKSNDTQFPNNYCTVEITEDELAILKNYLSDPENNYYSLLTYNCGGAVQIMWNLVTADHPELHVSADYTGVVVEPESLYFELARIASAKTDAKTGKDFYPRSLAYRKYSHEWVKGLWYNTNGTQTYRGIGSWEKDSKGWEYVDTTGWKAVNRWQKIDGKWYFFGPDGYMERDAYRKGYYLDKNGVWDEKDPVTGWKQTLGQWRYYISRTEMISEKWQMIDGKWYYFDQRGIMAEEEFVNGWWVGKGGAQKDPVYYRWFKDSKGWWYGVKGGWYAKNNTYTIDGQMYIFDRNGYCLNP